MRKVMMMLAAGALAAPASAGPLSSCTLTLSVSGKLTMSGDGLTLSTQNNGGLSAIMAVVAVNLTPKLTFSALSTIGPAGWSGAPTSYLAVASLSGVRQAYTTGTFILTPGILTDTLTFDARIVNAGGFRAGTYTASSTVTCEAA